MKILFFLLVSVLVFHFSACDGDQESSSNTISEGWRLLSETTIGDRETVLENGTWWGENTTKVISSGESLFTYNMTGEGGEDPFILYLYQYDRNLETWSEGQSFPVSRPLNLLVDSAGLIHVIGYSPVGSDVFTGRVFHVKFKAAGDVSGSYDFEYLTPDPSGSTDADVMASIFLGAAIDDKDTILVAYSNSPALQAAGSHRLGARLFQNGSWSYETIVSNSPSRLTYPIPFVSEAYFHVVAIEDDYDEDLAGTGYSYRYGLVRHYQRPIADPSGWQETTLLDFNGALTDLEISGKELRIQDLLVLDGVVHVLVGYREEASNFESSKVFHYTKSETNTSWESEEISSGNHQKGIFYQNGDGKLYAVVNVLPGTSNLGLVELDSKVQFDLTWSESKSNAAPFVPTARSGSDLGNTQRLDIFLYQQGGNETPSNLLLNYTSSE